LAGVGGERLDVAALALGVDGVEDQGGLAGAGDTGHDSQAVVRDREGDVLEIMDTPAADEDRVVH
jgi:hypothetical protein